MKALTRIEKELQKYYNHSAHFVGYVSWFPAAIKQIEYGKTTATPITDLYSDAMLRHIRENRMVYKRLHNMTRKHSRVLDASFDQEYLRLYPTPIVQVFGQYTGAALCTTILTKEEMIKLCKRKIKRTIRKDDNTILEVVKTEALKLYMAAINEYRNTSTSTIRL